MVHIANRFSGNLGDFPMKISGGGGPFWKEWTGHSLSGQGFNNVNKVADAHFLVSVVELHHLS